MTRGIYDHRVQHGNHAPAKLGTQINMLFFGKPSCVIFDIHRFDANAMRP